MAVEVLSGESTFQIITGSVTTNLKTTPSRLGRLVVTNVGTTMTIDVYDHASGNNNKLVEYVSADGKMDWDLGCRTLNGIRVVLSGTIGVAFLTYS